MKFYAYAQNNSGGVFIGPARLVIVQAKDAETANARMRDELGVTFGTGACLDCCGPNWSMESDAWHSGYESLEAAIVDNSYMLDLDAVERAERDGVEPLKVLL